MTTQAKLQLPVKKPVKKLQKMTQTRLGNLVAHCNFPGYKFKIGHKGDNFTVHGEYDEICIASKKSSIQKTRKYLISPHAVRSEVTQTLLKLLLTSHEHRVREHFTYKGELVYGPHFDVEALWALAHSRRIDVRKRV